MLYGPQTGKAGGALNYGERDPMKPHRDTTSIEKAKRMIGYEPKFDLEKGLALYVDWYKELWNATPHKDRARQETGVS